MPIDYSKMSEDEIRDMVKELALALMRKESYSAWEIDSMFRHNVSEAEEIRQREMWAEMDIALEDGKGPNEDV